MGKTFEAGLGPPWAQGRLGRTLFIHGAEAGERCLGPKGSIGREALKGAARGTGTANVGPCEGFGPWKGGNPGLFGLREAREGPFFPFGSPPFLNPAKGNYQERQEYPSRKKAGCSRAKGVPTLWAGPRQKIGKAPLGAPVTLRERWLGPIKPGLDHTSLGQTETPGAFLGANNGESPLYLGGKCGIRRKQRGAIYFPRGGIKRGPPLTPR